MDNSRLENTQAYQPFADLKQPPCEPKRTQTNTGKKVLWTLHLKIHKKLVSITPQTFFHLVLQAFLEVGFSKPGGMKPIAQIHAILRCLSSSVNIWRMPVIALVIQLFLSTRNMPYSLIVFWHLQIYVAIIILSVTLTPQKQLTLSRQHIVFTKLWQ